MRQLIPLQAQINQLSNPTSYGLAAQNPFSMPASSFAALPALSAAVKKSEGCRDYKKGRCERGRECKFNHTIEICGDFLKGICQRGEDCRYSHNKLEVDTCKDFQRGKCARETGCRFFHDAAGQTAAGKRGRDDDEDGGEGPDSKQLKPEE